ncbi:MAG: hypothetical protein AB1611_21740 [bacterium]
MHDSDNSKAVGPKAREILVAELIDALEEELELENPFIPEDEKNLWVKYMLQDIFQREGCEPGFDISNQDFWAGRKLTQEINKKDIKVIYH